MKTHAINPLKGIGPVELGDSLDKIRALGFVKNLDLSEAGVDCYEFDDLGLLCYLEDHRVTSVKCWTSCTLNGKQILGISEASMIDILGKPERIEGPIWMTEERYEKSANYDQLGISVWLEDGRTMQVDLWWGPANE